MRRYFIGIFLIVAMVGCGGADDPVSERDAVTRWVLSKGGRLLVTGKTAEIKSPQEVPSTRYNIEKINLSERPVTDADLAQLKDLKNLKSLSLYRTDIGDKGIESIAGLTSLQELELSYTRITDEGLKKLTGLKNLRKLFLRGTADRVTAGGIKTIHEDLPGCEVFR